MAVSRNLCSVSCVIEIAVTYRRQVCEMLCADVSHVYTQTLHEIFLRSLLRDQTAYVV